MKLATAVREIEELLCGTCNSFDIGEFAEDHDLDEMKLAQAMDDAEIDLCDGCGWWQYPGEYTLGHKDECDHNEIVCGDCCDA